MFLERLRRLGCVVSFLAIVGAGTSAMGDERLKAAEEAYGAGEFAMSDRPEPGFEEAATRAIEQWRYRPVLRDGEPVDVVLSAVVDFTLM